MKRLICIIVVLCAVSVQVDAQDLKSILSGIAKTVVGDKATTETSLIGTWSYVGPDCQLKGDNVLTNLGGEAAGGRVPCAGVRSEKRRRDRQLRRQGRPVHGAVPGAAAGSGGGTHRPAGDAMRQAGDAVSGAGAE